MITTWLFATAKALTLTRGSTALYLSSGDGQGEGIYDCRLAGHVCPSLPY